MTVVIPSVCLFSNVSTQLLEKVSITTLQVQGHLNEFALFNVDEAIASTGKPNDTSRMTDSPQ